jgi:hypothetical protein
MTFTFWHFKFTHFSRYVSWSLKICYLGYFCFCRYFGYPRFCSHYYFNMTCTVTLVTILCRDASLVSISHFYLSCHAVNTDHKKADWPLCLMKHLSMETYGEVEVWLHSCITLPPRQWSASHPFSLIPSVKKRLSFPIKQETGCGGCRGEKNLLPLASQNFWFSIPQHCWL